MATYGGGVREVIPEKSSYSPGQIVRVKIKYWAERSNSYSAGYVWHSRFSILVGDQVVEEHAVYHTVAPWTAVDHEEVETSYYSLGQMPSGGLSGQVQIRCGG